eukprot:Plantae.Rhodophyta-Hildenbrandia_rubra.ctg15211.p2 GENE.Plantae.Rhodophyta-Hildenbrandia_rubra.ctg15211~~Plantae.Rhodophyta-Hildenbrandia_rubra.ctg15211.p2  ORF type:complete len:101 (+),score=8.31 Plantae.Rhodophyta-Hildenbrandia_rubra.ctg15211:443-745(+)
MRRIGGLVASTQFVDVECIMRWKSRWEGELAAQLANLAGNGKRADALREELLGVALGCRQRNMLGRQEHFVSVVETLGSTFLICAALVSEACFSNCRTGL